MPLPLPNLDNRTYPDLVEEGRALIPRYAPTWTDHNTHDPGITMLELLAWLTEMTVYRLNQVPERHRRKFLSLIGFEPRPPQAAQTVLSFSPDEGTSPFLLPAGIEFEAMGLEGQSIPFRTLRDLTVTTANLAAVTVETRDAAGNLVIRDRTRDWRAGLPVAALGLNPQPDDALYLGFSELPTGVPLTLAFRFQGPGNDAQERQRLIAEIMAQRDACRHILPDLHCDDEVDQPSSSAGMLLRHHSARIVWEFFSGETTSLWQPLEPVAGLGRPDLGQVMDDTRSLTLDGIVEVNLPISVAATTLGPVTEAYFYLRCRLVDGKYDAPPMLVDITANGVLAEQAVPVFQTFTIPADIMPAGPAPDPGTRTRFHLQLNDDGSVAELTFLETAATPDVPEILVLDYQQPVSMDDPSGPAAGQITPALVHLGYGNGRPDQHVTLPQAPVQVDSFQLYTFTEEIWQCWSRRPDLDASGRTDAHFVLDATSGQITFGDGERGRTPPPGALILAAYRTTQAERGNVGAGTINQPVETLPNSRRLAGLPQSARDQLPQITTNRAPAGGGAATETVASAIGRAIETLHAHERLSDLCAEMACQTLDQIEPARVLTRQAPSRAVNLLDLERLALEVPGTRIVRARAWPNLHPDYPCLQASGTVTLVVLPALPLAKPEPSPGLLEVVKRYLNRRRLVTTRLEVVGPNYLEVTVTAQIRLRPHTDAARVRQAVCQALDKFLDPRRGGPDGLGWPFGRDVYRSEILQVIDGVPGVDYVKKLRIRGGQAGAQCGNLSLCPTWLVTPGKHQIEMI